MSLYDVNIDFDEASKMWRQNKKHIGNGVFKYICCAINKNGLPCNNKPNYNSDYCFTHLYFIKDNTKFNDTNTYKENYNNKVYKSDKKNKNYNKCIMICKNGKKCERLKMNELNYCFTHYPNKIKI
jgi:hypothetical protein